MPSPSDATRYATIRKDQSSFAVAPNLSDYGAACTAFDWDQARKSLSGLPSGGLNIAYEAVDRHARGSRAERIALRWIGKAGERRDVTYRELAASTNRFANALRSMGVRAGDGVFILLGRVPELYIAMLGALKAKCVVSPLFSAFGPEPIATRMEIGEARVLVTTEALYRRKVEALREKLAKLEYVILIDSDEDGKGTRSWRKLTQTASETFEIQATNPQETALLHFTSGTTGRPKGVIHV